MQMKNIMTAFAAVQQLASITRYSKDAIVNKESVLEHTGFVCLFSYVMADHMRGISNIDISKLLARAVVHDLDEIFVGDIPRITKYATPEMTQQFKELERVAIKRLTDVLDLSLGPATHWLDAKSNDIEGFVIRAADMAAVVYKTWQETELSGNNAVVRIAFELYTKVIPAFASRVRMSGLTENEVKFLLKFVDGMDSIARSVYAKCEKRIMPISVRTLVEFNMKDG